MTMRRVFNEFARVFDLSWFVLAMREYRRMFGEALVALLSLQVLALTLPPSCALAERARRGGGS
jgi:ABC-type bacteriocin/lantibiotic exporter with double-glycine peptidase domain